MKCKICRQDAKNRIHIKDGYVCKDCCVYLPNGLVNNASKYTSRQIRELQGITKRPRSQHWAKMENLKICEKSIIVNYWEIDLKDIRRVSLNFHPHGYGYNPGTAEGVLSIVIEVSHPRIIIEEPFLTTALHYTIYGKEISYSYPPALVDMLNKIQSVLDRRIYSMHEYMKKDKVEEEQKKRKEQKKTYSKQKGQKGRSQNSQPSPYDQAKRLFGVEPPYTVDEIKKIRNILIKKYHPDSGGSTERCAMINTAYDILLKFASDS